MDGLIDGWIDGYEENADKSHSRCALLSVNAV